MKLSFEVEKKITEDWARRFPGLGIYEPMWLLRRTGPLLSGICLEGSFGNDSYRPVFHVHSLTRPSSTVSLTLADHLLTKRTQAAETIRAAFHENRYWEAASRMKSQAPLPLTGPLSCDQVLRAYHQYMKTPLGRVPLLLYDDIIAVLVWCGRLEEATASLKGFLRDVRSWPSSINVLRHTGGVEQWVKRCQSWIENPTDLRATVEREVIKLEVDHLPTADFICD